MCCLTCSNQVHMLFTEKELERMTLTELVETDSMVKYLKWVRKRKGNFRTKMSTRIK